MKSIFKNLKYLFVVAFLSLPLLKPVSAVCKNGQIPSAFNPNCDGEVPTVGDIIAKFVPVIPPIIGFLLFGILLWGSIQIFTSGPNDDAKKKGFQTIQNAIIGVVILFVSVGLITLLESILGVKLLYGVFIK